MATYGIIADIHGNREALEAVLRLLDAKCVDQIVCLGDIVGYNAEPNECIALLAARGVESIAGNHDLISIRHLGFSRCANKVIYALRRTRRRLSAESRTYLAALPASRVYERAFALIHGGVDDVEYYMRKIADVCIHAERFRARFPDIRVCFFGHIHEQQLYEITGDQVSKIDVNGVIELASDRLYFVNPGSVDAARKSGKRQAQCAVFNVEQRSIEFLKVEYDHAGAEARAKAAGYRIGPGMAWVYSWRRRLKRWFARAIWMVGIRTDATRG